tara:strand:+ start:400 stop:552 length:153 start_codon:yes stop_codon:yes gene_type:complete
MNIPVISLKRSLDVTMKDTVERLKELKGSEKKALEEEFREWFLAIEGCKA